MTKPMEIAMAFITDTESYFFEHRKKGYANGALGKIGCWGGQIKPGETPLAAVHREVTAEEVKGLKRYKPDHFWQLSHEPLKVVSDRDDDEVEIKAHVFKLFLPVGGGKRLEAPNSVWLNIDELQEALNSGQLTPATEKASIELLGMKREQ